MGLSQKSFQGVRLQHTNKVKVPEYVEQMLTRQMENKQVVKMEAKPTEPKHIPQVSVSAKANPCT